MKKVIRIGRSAGVGNVFCSIEWKDNRLSISGVEGPYKSGNAKGSCGQIAMHMDNGYFTNFEFAPNWSKPLVDRFLSVWKEYHLNDMQAGCIHQRARGWRSYDEHPSEPCLECGYKYGSAWLSMDVPEDVIEFLKALPDTDKIPAWV